MSELDWEEELSLTRKVFLKIVPTLGVICFMMGIMIKTGLLNKILISKPSPFICDLLMGLGMFTAIQFIFVIHSIFNWLIVENPILLKKITVRKMFWIISAGLILLEAIGIYFLFLIQIYFRSF